MLLLPQKIATSFLALLRLVSVAYILKNLPAFRNKSNPQYSTIILYLIKSLAARHVAWIRILNAKVWERMQFEDSFIPSMEALTLHWLRAQWCSCAGNRQIVAAFNCHQLKTMGKEWRVNPTENNRCTVQDCGLLLCGCACNTRQCSCEHAEKKCRPGCRCTACHNRLPETESEFLKSTVALFAGSSIIMQTKKSEKGESLGHF